MEYKINNLKCIKDKHEKQAARELIDQLTGRLERVADNYPKPVVVNIFFNKTDNINYQVSIVANLKEHVVYIKEKGKEIEAVLYTIFDRLKLLLNKKIEKERKEYLYKRQKLRLANFNEHMQGLIEFNHEDNQEVFNNLARLLLNDVASYIRRRIKSAETTKAIGQNTFNPQEILDELYLKVYEKKDEIPKQENQTQVWLYKFADRILDNKLKEVEFEKANFERLDAIIEAEYKLINVGFTTDAENEIIPIEELDDIEYAQGRYSARDLLFEEDEDTLLDDILLSYNRRSIHKIIQLELAKLPVLKRTVMDLYLISQFTEEEIAALKDLSVKEVEAIINESSKDVKRKLAQLL